MKRALEELKKEESRIARLPPEHFEKMAKDQDATGEKTGKHPCCDQVASASQGSHGPLTRGRER